MKVTNAVTEHRDNQQPLTLAEQEACRQFEESDRAARAMFRPWVASGKATPDCLVFFEGICRFGVMVLTGYYSVENGQWYHRENDHDAPAPVDNPLEAAWQGVMAVKAQIRAELDIGAWFVPVVVFVDMAPDDDILDEVRNRKVRLLWGMAGLVERLLELPERDDLYPRLNQTFIAQEIDALTRPASRATPAPEQMAMATDLGAGPLVLQRVDTVNIHVTIGASAVAGGDAPPLVLQHADTVNVYVTIAASAGTDDGSPQVTVEG